MNSLNSFNQRFLDTFSFKLQSLILLLLRFYVASIFLKSGVQKISNWDSTLFLFENVYQVPLLPANLAAVIGTAAELIFPILLVIGLLTRYAALALFAFNAVAVLSYPALWKGEFNTVTAFDWFPIGLVFPTKGFEDHVVWGLILLTITAFGAGKIGLGNFFCKKNET